MSAPASRHVADGDVIPLRAEMSERVRAEPFAIEPQVAVLLGADPE